MSLRLKIFIGVLAVYTITVSVLLILVGKKLSETNESNSKYKDLENTINGIKEVNDKLFKRNSEYLDKIDSIGVIVNRVDKGISDISFEKKKVTKKYNSKISELKGKSIDSLKIIALEP